MVSRTMSQLMFHHRQFNFELSPITSRTFKMEKKKIKKKKGFSYCPSNDKRTTYDFNTNYKLLTCWHFPKQPIISQEDSIEKQINYSFLEYLHLLESVRLLTTWSLFLALFCTIDFNNWWLQINYLLEN